MKLTGSSRVAMAQTSAVPLQPTDVHSIELSGRLNVSTQNPADFVLLLALHESKALQSLQFYDENDDEMSQQNSVEESLRGVNHYPPVAFFITPKAVERVNRQNCLRAEGKFQDAWLEECANPTPIHYKNDADSIDAQVLENCCYRVQHALLQQDLPDSSIDIDPTLLMDIVPSSQTML